MVVVFGEEGVGGSMDCGAANPPVLWRFPVFAAWLLTLACASVGRCYFCVWVCGEMQVRPWAQWTGVFPTEEHTADRVRFIFFTFLFFFYSLRDSQVGLTCTDGCILSSSWWCLFLPLFLECSCLQKTSSGLMAHVCIWSQKKKTCLFLY